MIIDGGEESNTGVLKRREKEMEGRIEEDSEEDSRTIRRKNRTC
jgi:hypothetical protein